MKRFWERVRTMVRAIGAALLFVLKVIFVLMLLVIPLPVGRLFPSVFDSRKKAVPTEVMKKR